MSNIEYFGDYSGIGQMMKSPEMGDYMLTVAEAVADELNSEYNSEERKNRDGYKAKALNGNTRRSAIVATRSRKAYNREIDSHAMLIAVQKAGARL